MRRTTGTKTRIHPMGHAESVVRAFSSPQYSTFQSAATLYVDLLGLIDVRLACRDMFVIITPLLLGKAIFGSQPRGDLSRDAIY